MAKYSLSIKSVVLLCLTAGVASAGPKRILYPMVVQSNDTAAASEFDKIISFDLDVSGWFLADKTETVSKSELATIDSAKWKNEDIFGLTTHEVSSSGGDLRIVCRLYEVEKGDAPVHSKTYSGSKKDIRKFAHAWAGEIVKFHTGEDGFFDSRMVGSQKIGTSKHIVAFDFDGENKSRITRTTNLHILPDFSPGGGKIAFTSYMRRNPDLYVVGAGGGRPKMISRRTGMNTGASFSPDGSKIALTLSRDGNPEIYVISASNGAIISRITNNSAIDTSPSWSPDGSQLAFVSDRQGGPQIFVVSSGGGTPKRVSFNGSYNTTPVWSPRKGEEIIAYTTRDGGKFDIVTLNLKNGDMKRITQGQGNNEEPSFSPDGRAIAFSSTRSEGRGVYISNAEGKGRQHLVFRGEVSSVSWAAR